MTEDEPGGDPAQGPQAGAASSEMRERLAPFVSEKILQSPVSEEEEGGALCTPRCEATGGADEGVLRLFDVPTRSGPRRFGRRSCCPGWAGG